MKLFITGSTGVLGSRTVKLLLKQQHEIYALIRSKDKAKILKEKGIHPIIGNLYDKEFMLKSTKGMDGFLNLASSAPKKFNTKAKDWSDYNKLHVDAIKILVYVIATNKIPFFIQHSSLLSYGDHADKWVNEMVKFTRPIKNTNNLTQDYLDILESTIRCEYILNHIYDNNFPRIILRFGMIYSSDSVLTQEFIEQLEKNVFPTINKGESYLNLIHANDAASAVVKCVMNYKNLIGQTFNISDDKPVTSKELTHYLAKKLLAKEPKDVTPILGNRLVGKFEANILLSSFRNNNDKFKQITDWNPKYKSYKEGFDEVLDDLKANN